MSGVGPDVEGTAPAQAPATSTDMIQTHLWRALPADLLALVFQRLDIRSQHQFVRVCKSWHQTEVRSSNRVAFCDLD